MAVFSADLAAAWDVVGSRPDLQPFVVAGDITGLARAAPDVFTLRNVVGGGPVVLDVGVFSGLQGLATGSPAYDAFRAAMAGTSTDTLGRGVGDIYQAGYVGHVPVASPAPNGGGLNLPAGAGLALAGVLAALALGRKRR